MEIMKRMFLLIVVVFLEVETGQAQEVLGLPEVNLSTYFLLISVGLMFLSNISKVISLRSKSQNLVIAADAAIAFAFIFVFAAVITTVIAAADAAVAADVAAAADATAAVIAATTGAAVVAAISIVAVFATISVVAVAFVVANIISKKKYIIMSASIYIANLIIFLLFS
jgi:hypothetical protein